MTQVMPQSLVHRGVAPVSGYFFAAGLLPEKEAQRRILALWMVGATVYRLERGLLLRLPVAQQARCEDAPGLPLVESNGLLLAMPLTPKELHDLAAPPGALALAQGGMAVVYDLSNAVQEDPATWLDMSEWRVVRPSTLGAPPAPPRLVAEAEAFDSRARMPGVPPEAPERAFVLEALRKAAQGERVQESGTQALATQGGKAAGTVGEKVAGWLRRLVGGASGGSKAADAESRLGDAAYRLRARLLQASGLAKVIGQQQAEYIGRMMEMFERGNLREALRHAIPMADMEGKPKPPALGTLTPRADLTLTLQRTPARSSVHLSVELHEHLMALYRQAFRRLETEGRIDEAAYVLADLLGVSMEAVSFLERHKRLRLAAELAEARNLLPGLVVRQWFLAGERARAILIARRTGAFADAVVRLQRTDADLARELRIVWAASRAAAGDYAGAMQAIAPELKVVWKIAEMRAQIAVWLDEAIALGGSVGAEMLARKIVLLPEHQTELRERVLALFEDESAETAAERLAFAVALAAGETTPLARTLARATVRCVLRDASATPVRIAEKDWQKLIKMADNGALRADVPSLPMPPAEAPRRNTPHIIRIPATDCGLFSIYDATLLPDGRCILALGEAGLRLVTRDGRTVTHVEQPAHRLVLSDHGNQVIALAPRGDVWRMARMNLITRRAEMWREAAISAFAPDHDGSLWFVAMEKSFLAIDVTATGFDALWRLPNLEGKVLTIARSNARCSFLLFAAGVTDTWGRPAELWTRMERWTHSLPDLYLRDRREVFCPPPDSVEGRDYASAITAEGDIYYVRRNVVYREAERSVVSEIVVWCAGIDNCLIATTPDQPLLLPPVISTDWIAAPIRRLDGIDCHVLQRKSMQKRAQISLGDATSVSVRIAAQHITLADDRGRLLVYDLDRGELVRNLRIR